MTTAEGNDIVYTSMALSVLSMIISVLSMMTKRGILESEDYVKIELDVRGEGVLRNFKKCRNRFRGLRDGFSMMFGIDKYLIEIQKPSQIPDGLRLRMYVHINHTKAIDTNCEKLLLEALKNGRMTSMLKEAWSLHEAPLVSNINHDRIESKQRVNSMVTISMKERQRIAEQDVIEMQTLGTTMGDTDGYQHDRYQNMRSLSPKSSMDEGTQNTMTMLPPMVPPVATTDYGEAQHGDDGNGNHDEDENESDGSEKFTVGTVSAIYPSPK